MKNHKEKSETTNKKLTAIPNYLVIIFISVITIVAVTTLILTNVRPFDYHRFDKLPSVTTEDWLTQTTTTAQSTYYVFIYKDGNPENADLIQKVIDYANFVRANKDAPRIYILRYTTENSSIINSNVTAVTSGDKLPVLITVKNSTVNSTFNTVSKISAEIDSKMVK